MVSNYLYTTSNPALGSAPLPSSTVGEYVNQQIIGAQNRQAEAQRNAFVQQPTFNREGQNEVAAKPASTGVEGAVKMVEDQNSRLSQLTQQVKAKQQAANTANVRSSGGGSYQNTYTVPAGVTGSRAQALKLASGYLGSRYVLGGTSKQGIDCSGLVMQVYNQLGYNITRHSATWQRDNIPGVRTNDINQLRPGDLVAWRDGSHIAVYAGNGEIIEAANERVGTVRRRLWANPSAVVGIKLRFPGE